MRTSPVVSVVFFLFLAFTAVGAQEQYNAPTTVTVTAFAPGVPGVITIEGEKAQRAGHTTVADALETVPGVTVQRSGSSFESSSIRLRGSSQRQVLILVDGQRRNDSRGTITDLARLDLSTVARIEVIRGAATARYGTGAAAGVINIVTTSPAPSSSEEGVSATATTRLSVSSPAIIRAAADIDLVFANAARLSTILTGVIADNAYQYQRAGGTTTRENADGGGGSLTASYTSPLSPNASSLLLSLQAATDRRGIPARSSFLPPTPLSPRTPPPSRVRLPSLLPPGVPGTPLLPERQPSPNAAFKINHGRERSIRARVS